MSAQVARNLIRIASGSLCNASISALLGCSIMVMARKGCVRCERSRAPAIGAGQRSRASKPSGDVGSIADVPAGTQKPMRVA
jgi:hypothetical protein